MRTTYPLNLYVLRSGASADPLPAASPHPARIPRDLWFVYSGGMDIHVDIEPISFLLGIWEGNGVGIYPTIDDFSYREEISFVAPPGKPFLHYSQKTWRAEGHPEAGTPLHTECGYVRPVEGGGAELVIAQPSGIAEVHSGSVDESTVSFTSDLVSMTRTAKEVISVDRMISVVGDKLSYEMWMGAVGQPHQLHLKASLQRVSSG